MIDCRKKDVVFILRVETELYIYKVLLMLSPCTYLECAKPCGKWHKHGKSSRFRQW